MLVVKILPANVGDKKDGSLPQSGKSPGGGHGNPLQYSCMENPMDRGACWTTVHRVRKSCTQWLNMHACMKCCIGTWNVRSMNQGKFKVVKQDMARVNIDILGIRKLKWTRLGEFNSDDHYIYYCRQESLRRNGVAIIVNKRIWNAVLGCNLKNDTMISVHF